MDYTDEEIQKMIDLRHSLPVLPMGMPEDKDLLRELADEILELARIIQTKRADRLANEKPSAMD